MHEVAVFEGMQIRLLNILNRVEDLVFPTVLRLRLLQQLRITKTVINPVTHTSSSLHHE